MSLFQHFNLLTLNALSVILNIKLRVYIMISDKLGDRMKGYENNFKRSLMKKTPVIIRVDGKAFHTFTKNIKKPFSKNFHQCLVTAANHTASQIQGCIIAYVQSDEVSFLLKDWDSIKTEAWFGYKQSKIESIAASAMTASFNYLIQETYKKTNDNVKLKKFAMFDARSFNLPREEVLNYFIWRQQDAIRNSVQTMGHYYLDSNQIFKKSNEQIKQLLYDIKGICWDNIPLWAQEGTAIIKVLEDPTSFATATPRKNSNIVDLQYESVNNKMVWKISSQYNNFLGNREFYEKEISRVKPTRR